MPETKITQLAKTLKPHLEPYLQSHGPNNKNEDPERSTELDEAMKVTQDPAVKAETATVAAGTLAQKTHSSSDIYVSIDMSLERLVQGGPVSNSESDKLNFKLFSEMQMRRKGQKQPVLPGNTPPKTRGQKKREQRARSFARSADASVFAAMEAAVASGRIRLPNQPPLAPGDYTPTDVKYVKISVAPVKLEHAAVGTDEEGRFGSANLYDIPAYKGSVTDTKSTTPSSADDLWAAVKSE